MEAQSIIYTLDQLAWEEYKREHLLADLEDSRPLFVRLANFYANGLDVVRRLKSNSLIVWKVEYMGEQGPMNLIRSDPHLDADKYVRQVRELGHRISAYTFTEFNRSRLRQVVPALRDVPIHIVPIAQKATARAEKSRSALRAQFGAEMGDARTVFGAGGYLHPVKGVEELVSQFVSARGLDDDHLVCSLIGTELTADEIRRSWVERFGEDGMRRVHIRVGEYGEWAQMCEFYSLIDVMLINSVYESWGRMVSEPVGLYTPTIIRRAECSTNWMIPGIEIVDSFNFGSAEFSATVKSACEKAAELGRYANTHYAIPTVRDRFIDRLVTPLCDGEERQSLDRLLQDPERRRKLDDAMTF